MKVYLGSDHAGFKLKEAIKPFLNSLGVDFEDLGAHKLAPNDDYPNYAFKVAEKTAKNKSFGILFCGSSHGVCIAANKVKGIRAVAVSDVKCAIMTREHNNANILCLSGWNISKNLSEKIIKAFLFTMFTNEKRHKRRINLITKYEK
ncbi:MAG: RpiB/LacA/LacB family sugar-phosphate isomerase [Nanoarchaeota archaeon]